MTPVALQQKSIDKKSIVKPPGCRSVYVKNIPYTCTEEEVTEVMKVCGPITTVRLPIWGHTQQLKGFGCVKSSA
jgi:RNA recognition motif-containing protein